MTLELLKSHNQNVQALLQKKDYNNPAIKDSLRKLKIVIYSTQNLHNQPVDILVQSRTFAQLNVFYTLITRSQKDFQKVIENVRFFYQNDFGLPQSSAHFQIKSIHLLYLLSSHRNEQFYSKLENLTAQQLRNPLISYVLKVNQAVQEGNYRKVFKLSKENTLEYLSSFLDRIKDTVRIEIAKSAQKAYSVLSIQEALQVFQLENQGQLKQFITKYTQSQQQSTINWVLDSVRIHFQKDNKNKTKFNSENLIKTCLDYAHELEYIA